MEVLVVEVLVVDVLVVDVLVDGGSEVGGAVDAVVAGGRVVAGAIARSDDPHAATTRASAITSARGRVIRPRRGPR